MQRLYYVEIWIFCRSSAKLDLISSGYHEKLKSGLENGFVFNSLRIRTKLRYVFFSKNCFSTGISSPCYKIEDCDIDVAYLSFAQKRMVLSDNSLPEEFRLALAEKLQQGIFSSVSKNIHLIFRTKKNCLQIELNSVKLYDLNSQGNCKRFDQNQIPFLRKVPERVRAAFAAEVYYSLSNLLLVVHLLTLWLSKSSNLNCIWRKGMFSVTLESRDSVLFIENCCSRQVQYQSTYFRPAQHCNLNLIMFLSRINY